MCAGQYNRPCHIKSRSYVRGRTQWSFSKFHSVFILFLFLSFFFFSCSSDRHAGDLRRVGRTEVYRPPYDRVGPRTDTSSFIILYYCVLLSAHRIYYVLVFGIDRVRSAVTPTVEVNPFFPEPGRRRPARASRRIPSGRDGTKRKPNRLSKSTLPCKCCATGP